MTDHLDRLESVLAQKDAEIQRLRMELDLCNLYVKELHDMLEAQARQLGELDRRLTRLEPAVVQESGTRLPLLIRIRKLL